MGQFISVRDFSRQVGLSERYLRQLIYDRKIPFLKLGSGKKPRIRINPLVTLPALEKVLERKPKVLL